MKPEKLVCLPELAKQLKELGVKQDGYWSWVTKIGRHNRGESNQTYLLETSRTYNFQGENICSAFTVAELANIFGSSIAKLPSNVHLPKELDISMCNEEQFYSMLYNADWLAGLGVYLLKNKLFEI